MAADKEILELVYTASTHDQLMRAYRAWAGAYDVDTVDGFGYVGHLVTARALADVVGDREARILDAGCGTGLVGQALRTLGFTRLEAIDASPEMLALARAKGVYQRLHQVDLEGPLGLHEFYDGVACAGTFTFGHVGPAALARLASVTRAGGHICFTVHEGAYAEFDFRAHIDALEESGRWTLIEEEDADYLQKEGVGCKRFTCRVEDPRAGER